MRTVIQSTGRSIKGTRMGEDGRIHSKQVNEDYVLIADEQVLRLNGTPWADFFAVVADGVGSSSNPHEAAKTAAEVCLQRFQYHFTERLKQAAERRDEERQGDKAQSPEALKPEALQSLTTQQMLASIVRDVFEQMNQHVYNKVKGGQAVAAAVCVQGRYALVGNVGDAQVLLLREGRLQYLTETHQNASGKLTSALGGSLANLQVAHRVVELQPGDRLLLCSDGLLSVVQEEGQLAKWVSASELSQVEYALSEAVRAVDQRDDASFVLAQVIEVGEPAWLPAAPEPAGVGASQWAAAQPASSPSPGDPTRRDISEATRTYREWQVGELENTIRELEARKQAIQKDLEWMEQRQATLKRQLQEIEAKYRLYMQHGGGPQSESYERPRKITRVSWRAVLAAELALMLVVLLWLGVVLGRQAPRSVIPPKISWAASKDSKSVLQLPQECERLRETFLLEDGIAQVYDTKQGTRCIAWYRPGGDGKPARIFVLQRVKPENTTNAQPNRPSPH